MRNRRLTSTAILLVLAVPVGMTGVAYACAPSNWGWTPPGAPSAIAVAPDASAQAPASTPAPDASTQPTSNVTQVTEQPTAQVPVKQASTSPSAKPATSAATEHKRTPVTGANSVKQAPRPVVAPRQTVVATAVVRAPVQRAASPAPSPIKQHGTHHATQPAKPHAASAATSADVTTAPVAAKPTSDQWTASANPVAGLTTDTGTSPAAGTDGRMLFGVALLGFGLVGLFGAFTVVEARRRRVHASSRATSDGARR